MESLPVRPQPSRPFSETVRAWVQWFGISRLIVTAGAVLAVGAGGYWLLRTPTTAVESTLPYARATTSGSPSTTNLANSPPTTAPPGNAPEPAALVVHVAGAVVAPAVYQLAAGSRVQQAIELAGGFTPDADRDALNLATLVHDGDRVFVPRIGETVPPILAPSGATGSATPAGVPSQPVDLNRATVGDLDALPGVGPSTAAAIVAYRDQHGPFGAVDDLLQVRGIGPSKLDALRGLVTT